MNDNNPDWEKKLLTKLAESSIKEQRRSRRWGIFFKLLTFFYIGIFFYFSSIVSLSNVSSIEPHTALVELNGVIADKEPASAENIITALRDAFENKNTVGVILRANSPGGSPVEAGYIYDEIKRLRKEYPKIKLYAVITDICASGCYYVASAADEIYANKASIVGSIGVRMDNFGFVDAMKKLGIKQRLLTAGKNKALLDPFQPENKTARQHLQAMLDEIHQQFIQAVESGRGKRLDTTVDGLFSGLVWTGQQAVKIGLVDATGNTSYVARKIIGEKNIVNYTLKDDLLQRFAGKLGASMATEFSTLIHTQTSLPIPQ